MAFFLEILLINKKNKCLSDNILAVWMFFIGIHLLGYYTVHTGLYLRYPHLLGIPLPLPLIHGSFLLLYIQSFTHRRQKLNRIDYLHYLPVVLAYTYMTKFFFFNSAQEKLLYVKNIESQNRIFSSIMLFALICSGVGYIT